ncbi:hypothetical protein C8R46DRAFT_425332 [Mycena filopes]|nr:hypothetical protein C8R46DRAFT_425332 [Mycena filopes]
MSEGLPWSARNKRHIANSPQAVYSSALLVAGRGTAVCTAVAIPRPGYEHLSTIPLGIGDVGWILRNAFYPTLRASEPARPDHMPKHFVPLEIGPVRTGSYPAGLQYARNLEASTLVNPGNTSSLIKGGTVTRFLPTTQHGGALFTKYRVWSSDIIDERPFADYMMKNYKSWVELTCRHTGKADLMFVTGVDMTSHYASVWYNHKSAGAPSDLIVPDSEAKATMKPGIHDHWEDWAYFSPTVPFFATSDPPMIPEAETAEYLQQLEDQHGELATNSIFIRALRFQQRRMFFANTRWAIALAFGGGEEPIEIDLDPLQPIADYIFSHSLAGSALFGDNDIKQLIQDIRPEEDLRALLKRLRPRVRVDKNFVGRIDPTFPVPLRWYSPCKIGQVLSRAFRRCLASPEVT